MLEGCLDAVGVAAWSLDLTSGVMVLSAAIKAILPVDFPLSQPLSSLLSLASAADQHAFSRCFQLDWDDREPERLRVCELHLEQLSSPVQLRFMGRLVTSVAGELSFRGIAMSSLDRPGELDATSNLLPSLLADSPVPSFITDARGCLVYTNAACENLLQLDPRQASEALGCYSLAQDPQLLLAPDGASKIAQVFQRALPASLELWFNPAHLLLEESTAQQARFLSLSLLPINDNAGQLTRVLVQLQDLSREKIARDALQESEASYKAFFTNSAEAIWCYAIEPEVSISLPVKDQVKLIARHAHLVEANRVLLRMLGVASLEEILGQGLIETGSKQYRFDIDKFVTSNYQMENHDIVRVDAQGKNYWLQISCTGIVEDGRLKRVWGTTRDVTARRRYEERLHYQSQHDALTGLPNREKLYQDMELCFQQADADRNSALLLIDLDRFREINDTLGHKVGDSLLKLVGPCLAAEMAEMPATVARLGGDEFAVFLPRIRNSHQAVVVGHRLLDALSQEFDLDGFCAHMSASMGIALAPQQAPDHHSLMRYAEIAMYHAKRQMLGLSIYSADYDPHSPKRLAMISELGRAIRESQLSLCFQPKVVLAEGRVYGVEALIRWQHPELGFVPPSEFIPIAELTSLIHPLTAWVMEKSIEQCRSWRQTGLQINVAVNLSARNLMDENIPNMVERLLAKYDLPASCLELEITESAIMSDPVRASRILQHLHDLGVHLAIDDFGTGYSSLAYLKRLPVGTLKIDNSFVRNMLEDTQDELIVHSTIHLAHNLGLKVVAEGVENQALLECLKKMGCDQAQGYFIGRPMSGAQLLNWSAASGWHQSRLETDA